MNVVTIDTKVKGGTPVVTGTRIPVKTVAYLHIKLKKSPAIIATKYYTQLSVDQIKKVLKWFNANGKNYGRMDL